MADVQSTCIVCGTQFQYNKSGPGRIRRFCGDVCKRTRVAIQTAQSKDRVDSGVRIYARPKSAGKPLTKDKSIACDGCGTVIEVSRIKSFNFCRTKCRDAYYQRARSAELRIKLGVRQCRMCNASFEPMFEANVYCSTACKNRVDNRNRGHRRRTRTKGEVVVPEIVFDRDQWRCQLCGVKTPKSLRGRWDNRSPELDHIIPLSKGGAHTYSNTQCACRACNIRKGAKPMGQMLLFG